MMVLTKDPNHDLFYEDEQKIGEKNHKKWTKGLHEMRIDEKKFPGTTEKLEAYLCRILFVLIFTSMSISVLIFYEIFWQATLFGKST